LAGLTALTGCVMTEPQATNTPSLRPETRAAAPASSELSAQSQALARYYARFQADLLAQGLLRTDGGGPDTPFSASDLARNFEQIVFYDEYVRGGGLRGARGEAARLRRWPDPVRITAEFGTSVSPAMRAGDGAIIRNYAARLARVTRHSVTTVSSGGNFHVLVMGEDDQDQMIRRVRQIVPDISAAALGIFEHLPKAIHCLVVAFSKSENTEGYGQAIALIRAEHPDLVRRSCYHEEMAQGLGLANDSPRARPSIFNDDDEFALLTTHDEMLLQMLYDPRLRIGMSAEEARPVVLRMARELVGGES
jgi:hypothetical protein